MFRTGLRTVLRTLQCRQWEAYRLDYALERLPASQKTAVEQHLQQCPDCRAQVAEYRQALNLALNARQQLLPTSQSTWESLRLQLQQNSVATRAAYPLLAASRWRLTGAGMALAGVAGLALWMPRASHHPQSVAIIPSAVPRPASSQQSTPQIALERKHAALQHSVASVKPTILARQRDNVTAKIVTAPVLTEAGLATIPAQITRPKQILRERAIAEGNKPGLQVMRHVPVQDDLAFLNPPTRETLNRWATLSPIKSHALEMEVTRLLAVTLTGDDFVAVPLPQIAGGGKQAMRAALEVYAEEAAVVDTRLARKIRLGVKGMALSALLKQISEETGLTLAANARVADDNVTLFCHERSLRDIMRQLSQHFGFQWLREGKEGAYAYELTQSVRSQLLEEEARNQDQDEAVIALDKAMEKYRKFRGMNPTSLREMEKTMKIEDTLNMFPLTQGGWLPANLYFGLSPEDMQLLRTGQPLNFAMSGENGSRSLPASLQPEILKSFDDTRINPHPGASGPPLMSRNSPADSLPLSSAKDIRITSELKLDRSQLGQLKLTGDIFLHVTTNGGSDGIGHGITLAEVSSPAVSSPNNALANVKHAHDADLQKRVTIEPEPSCKLEFGANIPDVEGMRELAGKKCTTADVLEAIFKATGKDVIGDFYTRLYAPPKVTETNATLFDALNRLGDTMHDRWTRDGDWLTFRSTSWFYDRPKEVPARKLARWAASWREHNALTLDDLMEIGQLSNTQLDALTNFEGALARYNLQEWNFARADNLRNHWRFLATVPAEMRLDLINGKELQANKLSLALQKKFVPLAVHDPDTDKRPGSKGMENPTLRIEYMAGHIPPDRPNLKSLLLSNPIVFVYTYGDPTRDKYDRRASLIGPFNAIIGTFAVRLEEKREQ